MPGSSPSPPRAEGAALSARISAVIASGHAGTRSSLAWLLSGDVELLGVARDLRETMQLLRAVAPDVVLLDMHVLGDAGLRRLPTLRSMAPNSAFLVLGMGDHPAYGTQAREAGAADYVRLDLAADRLDDAISSALAR